MAYASIAIGSVWMVFGATMVYAGLFDRNPIPSGLDLRGLASRAVAAVQVPIAMIAGTWWVARFSLRASLGLGRRPKASH